MKNEWFEWNFYADRYIEKEVAQKYLREACKKMGSNGGLKLQLEFNDEPTITVHLFDDGTLLVTTDKYKDVKRVLLSDRDTASGEFFYKEDEK